MPLQLQSNNLHVRVTRAQHRGKPGGLFLSSSLFAWLFKVPMIAHDLQGPFTVDFLLQSPQGFFYRLAFFKLNFCQLTFTSSPQTSGLGSLEPGIPL